MVTCERIYAWLEEVKDPEVPVLSLRELGVLRKVEIGDKEEVTITITPTYSGCPAMNTMEIQIREMLTRRGLDKFKINTVLHPPWTTDWMSSEAKEKLRRYGIAPPEGTADKNSLLGKTKTVACPRCQSRDTQMLSQFGSTACKSLYQCRDCMEPFDYFKCI
jgi:ring-1,2-phenylacetyl-CoA epoxidase subunit PaaD